MTEVLPQHVDAMARGARCTECPLYGCGRGPVPSTIGPGAAVAIAGEAPGDDEVDRGINFIGMSGQFLDASLLTGGLVRSGLTVINAQACQQPGGLEEYIAKERRRAKRDGREFKTPTECCQPRFDRDLDDTQPRTFLSIGKAALASTVTYLRSRSAYSGDDLVLAQVNMAPVPLDDGRFLFAAYHPAYALRPEARKWIEPVRKAILRAALTAQRGTIEWSEPPYLLNPPIDDAIAWIRNVRGHRVEVTVDLETCDPITGRPSLDQHGCALRCTGLGATINGAEYVMVLPFRHMDGTSFSHNETSLALLVDELRMLFDESALAGHNIGPFDSPIMLRPASETVAGSHDTRGLLSVRNRLLEDTLVLHHNTPSQDHSHGLSFCGREAFEVPAWKSKEDVTSTDNADDEKLWIRCARDVLVTMRLLPTLRMRVEAAGTVPQHQTDTQINRILRDMSELGMCLDEAERGRMSRILGNECERLRRRWVELVGKDVNPRSVPQMQTLLYEDWDQDPPLNTQQETPATDEHGNPIETFEADEGSTGVGAILALLEHGSLTAQQQEALNVLLEYKALDKPRASYCDNTETRRWPTEEARIRLPAEGGLPERDRFSWIRPTWGIGRTPVGRSVAANPGEQQRPKLGRELPYVGLTCSYCKQLILVESQTCAKRKTQACAMIVNMRRMVVAAPGHVLVGCDLKQSHVRIYTASAGDQILYDAIKRNLNVHVLNVSALLADNEVEMWKTYERILNSEPNVLEYWKLVAKRYVFALIYGAIWQTIHETMRKMRIAATGKLAFPSPQLKGDCEVWHGRWHKLHSWTGIWQAQEIAAYEARGYAMSPVLDQRRRYGLLEHNMIPNHAILAFEGSLKNRAMIALDQLIPHRGWSDWSGQVGDFHDSLLFQVPESRGEEAARLIQDAMSYEWRDMQFGGDAKITKDWGSQ